MGAMGLGELDEAGEVVFRRLERVAVRRRQNRGSGRYRFYVDYRLPSDKGGGIVQVGWTRLPRMPPASSTGASTSGASRSTTPTTNGCTRGGPMPSPSTALWTTPSGSDGLTQGRQRQLFELMGFALMTNALAGYRHTPRALTKAA